MKTSPKDVALAITGLTLMGITGLLATCNFAAAETLDGWRPTSTHSACAPSLKRWEQAHQRHLIGATRGRYGLHAIATWDDGVVEEVFVAEREDGQFCVVISRPVTLAPVS